jgi:hypothetical protein
MHNHLSFRNGFDYNAIEFLAQKRAFRENFGGSAGLEQESKQEIREGLSQLKRANLKNPEEILNEKTVDQLDANLNANPLQRPWWDSGAHETVGDVEPETNEDLVMQSRTSNMNFDNRLQPNPALQAQQSAAKDLRTLKEEFKKAQGFKHPKKF